MLRMVPLPRSASLHGGGEERVRLRRAARGICCRSPPILPRESGGGGPRVSAVEGAAGGWDYPDRAPPPPPCFAWSPSPVSLRCTGEEKSASGCGEPRVEFAAGRRRSSPAKAGEGVSAVEGAAGGWDYPDGPQAPSTMLRMVPLPRFASLHGGGGKVPKIRAFA